MKKYSKFSTVDFATDPEFIKWILTPTTASCAYWTEIIKKYPEQKKTIDEAIFIVQSLQAKEDAIPADQTNQLWNKIVQGQLADNKKRNLSWLQWAAVIVILIGIGSVVWENYFNGYGVEIPQAEIIGSNNGQVILADGSVESIENKSSEIEVTSSGKIMVEDRILETEKTKTSQQKLNHVVMPYGRQARLQLPDGSTVYINSGSKFSFPTQFTGNKREVYIAGEAFFQVKPNAQKPFVVLSQDIEVIVTGTEFNISAYADDDFSQTVLVSGEVSVRKNNLISRKVKVNPGESAMYKKESDQILIQNVDTRQYTSWIDGYIICKKESIVEITRKLERYYNCKIEIGLHMSEITFSGKLDLQEDIEKALETISYASSLQIEKVKNVYVVK